MPTIKTRLEGIVLHQQVQVNLGSIVHCSNNYNIGNAYIKTIEIGEIQTFY